MQNKFKLGHLFLILGIMVPGAASALDVAVTETVTAGDDTLDMEMEEMSADAVAAYDPNGSLFQQITDLEQEKILMQLEKERAQLDLELDRLAAEKIKLHMEIDTLSGRAEQQQQEIEAAQAKLEAETARLEREKEALANRSASSASVSPAIASPDSGAVANTDISNEYRLVNVVGAGAQLQATLQNLSTGQNKRVSVGKKLDGFTVKSISLDEGVVFTDADGNVQTLNVAGSK